MKARLVLLAPLVLWVGCASTTPPAPGASAPPACPPTAAATAVAAGESLPTPGPNDTMAGPRVLGTVTTNPWHAVKNGAVVYIEGAPKEPGVGMAAAVDNHDMSFVPFISVVTAGGTVTFGNTDPLVHNVFSPDNDKWDIGNLPQNGSVAKKFDTPGTYALLCNFHQNMLGYLVVSPSSYFAKTTPEGRYVIAHAPAGTFKVTAWVPRMQPVSQTVTVPATGDVTADFKLQ
jgi:plastocyanin